MATKVAAAKAVVLLVAAEALAAQAMDWREEAWVVVCQEEAVCQEGRKVEGMEGASMVAAASL